MNPIIRFFGRRKGAATLKREFSALAFIVWVGVTIRLFTSGNPEWIAAQAVNYGTLTTTVWLFITAAVGIQAWQNTKDAAPAAPLPDQEDGEIVREPTPEDRARSAG